MLALPTQQEKMLLSWSYPVMTLTIIDVLLCNIVVERKEIRPSLLLLSIFPFFKKSDSPGIPGDGSGGILVGEFPDLVPIFPQSEG